MARDLVLNIMDKQQREEFFNKELNFALARVLRVFVVVFYQRNLAGMVLRRIGSTIPT